MTVQLRLSPLEALSLKSSALIPTPHIVLLTNSHQDKIYSFPDFFLISRWLCAVFCAQQSAPDVLPLALSVTESLEVPPCRRAVVNLTFVRLPSSQTKKTYLFGHTTMYKRRRSRLNCTEEGKKRNFLAFVNQQKWTVSILYRFASSANAAGGCKRGSSFSPSPCSYFAFGPRMNFSERRTLFIPFSVFCLKTLNSCLLRTAQMYFVKGHSRQHVLRCPAGDMSQSRIWGD